MKFFRDQMASFDPNQITVSDLGFNMDDTKEEVDDCLETAKIMGHRLEELNENIIQYLIQSSSSKQTK